jgi:hypothetical protein
MRAEEKYQSRERARQRRLKMTAMYRSMIPTECIQRLNEFDRACKGERILHEKEKHKLGKSNGKVRKFLRMDKRTQHVPVPEYVGFTLAGVWGQGKLFDIPGGHWRIDTEFVESLDAVEFSGLDMTFFSVSRSS